MNSVDKPTATCWTHCLLATSITDEAPCVRVERKINRA